MEITHTKSLVPDFTTRVNREDHYTKTYLQRRSHGELHKTRSEGDSFIVKTDFHEYSKGERCHLKHELIIIRKKERKQTILQKLLKEQLEIEYEYLAGDAFSWKQEIKDEQLSWPQGCPDYALWSFPLIMFEKNETIIFGITRKKQILVYRYGKYGLQLISYTD